MKKQHFALSGTASQSQRNTTWTWRQAAIHRAAEITFDSSVRSVRVLRTKRAQQKQTHQSTAEHQQTNSRVSNLIRETLELITRNDKAVLILCETLHDIMKHNRADLVLFLFVCLFVFVALGFNSSDVNSVLLRSRKTNIQQEASHANSTKPPRFWSKESGRLSLESRLGKKKHRNTARRLEISKNRVFFFSKNWSWKRTWSRSKKQNWTLSSVKKGDSSRNLAFDALVRFLLIYWIRSFSNHRLRREASTVKANFKV